jgi:PPOX class probable FMN-dependent enzyme
MTTPPSAEIARYEEHDVVLNGMRLHYLEWVKPDGDAVVFLHGGGLTAHTWDTVAAAIADTYHCYALDLRGHGDSEWSPTLEYDLDAHARDLERFVDHHGIKRFFLVGHSLGAFTALRYAAEHSHRIAGLVAVDATPFVEDSAGVDRVRRFALEKTTFSSLDEAVDYAHRFQPQRDRAALRDSVHRSLREQPDGTWAWKDDRRHVNPGHFTTRIQEARALLDDLHRVRCPTLVIRGSDGCPSAEASRFAALLHDGRFVTVDAAGHNVHRDNPAGFLKALRSFLDEYRALPMTREDLTLKSVDHLRSVYRAPAQRSLDKEIDRLDHHCRDFIAHAPFVVLASASKQARVDVSPKGGPSGFVAVLDDHRLAIPDMAGNNRLDSMRNIVGDGAVALLFLVPGTDETLRVNGHATITTDPTVLGRCRVGELRPNVALVVEVRAAFIHCAKALRRANLWHPEQWPETSDMATPATMLKDHIGLESVEDSQRALDASYAATTWKVGGCD